MTTDALEIWWEGKAFRRWMMYDPAKESGEVGQEFRGANAEAEARAWFVARAGIPEFDAVYVYAHEPQSESVTERTLILAHHDTYPYVGDDEDDEYDYSEGGPYDPDDDDYWDNELDEIDEVSYDAADGTEGSN